MNAKKNVGIDLDGIFNNAKKVYELSKVWLNFRIRTYICLILLNDFNYSTIVNGHFVLFKSLKMHKI